MKVTKAHANTIIICLFAFLVCLPLYAQKQKKRYDLGRTP